MGIKSVSCGLNGFGRFGLHFLSNYIQLRDTLGFSLTYINDEKLSIFDAVKILNNDKYVQLFKDFKIYVDGEYLVISNMDYECKIRYTNSDPRKLSWLGKPDIFLECSGRYTDATLARMFKTNNTRVVLISATSLNADQTLVYGYNHHQFDPNSDVISYGSCTVNAFSALTNFLADTFVFESVDVNVIHNLPEHMLTIENRDTLVRKKCTLSKVAPIIIDCITDKNLYINYTLIPYSGVSIMDFKYSFDLSGSAEDVFSVLENEVAKGSLKGLYGIQEFDNGPQEHQNTRCSAVIIKESSKVIGNHLYLHTYFDNENSANRYIDLTNYIAEEITLG